MEYAITFQVYFNKEPTGWSQIIDFHGDKPGLYYGGGANKDKFQVESAVTGNSSKSKFATYKMVAKKWYNLEISQLVNDVGEVRNALQLTCLYSSFIIVLA